MNTADIALCGREIYPYEYYEIYRRSQLLTVEIPVAAGSYDQIGKSAALGVFVHADNPIARLSLPSSTASSVRNARAAGRAWSGTRTWRAA
ncbi:MAG: Phosphate transport system substrate-binding protein [Phenylobacterium sp.]|jgi:hypothetical protein|nr:Phosphate transport system substrate-binding protein [Phenylobacterium sp.]MDB5465368.1 Phosphate transport system substrate-binding protein [Phenylobacterium sp.]